MQNEETLVQLDPSKVLAEDNARYGLLDLDGMKNSIKELGGIMQPVEVEPLVPPANGHNYRLISGFRRHAAALSLNADEGAALALPAIVRSINDPVMRLRHQLAENVERRNLSPMDEAQAIKRCFDAGMTRQQIRELFKRPSPDGKKSSAPASNAWVNMTMSFLSFTKDIREKIHTGRIGVKAAYQLTRVPKDKWAEVIEKSEKEREALNSYEEKLEEKWEAQTEKVAEAEKKAEEATTEIDHARVELELAQKDLAAKQEKAHDLYRKVLVKGLQAEDKKKAHEAFKAAEADAKGAEKKLEAAQKALTKIEEGKQKLEDIAKAHREKLEAAAALKKTKVGKPKSKAVTQADVIKAAKASGVDDAGHVALSAQDMRKLISDLSLPGTYPKVTLIGQSIQRCIQGITTPGIMLKELAAITGELKAAPTTKAK